MIELYLNFVKTNPLVSSAIQVAILGMIGELLAIKIRQGEWHFFGPAGFISKLVIWAFALLAIGDTGHVGFRVLAYVAIGFLAYDDLYPRYQEHTLQN